MIERQNDAPDSVVLALTTFSEPDSARQIGTQLVKSQLIACFNLIPAVESIYQWKGDLEIEGELIAIMKTTRQRLDELGRWMADNHPYEEPELIVIPVDAGAAAYLQWIRDHTG